MMTLMTAQTGGNHKRIRLMKKIVFALTTLALIAASCAKEAEISGDQNYDNSIAHQYSLRATVNQESTKVLTDNTGRFSWQAGDVISVLDNTNTPQEYTTTTGGADVNFSGSIAPDDLGNYAFYPANSGHSNTVFALGPEIDWSANASNMPMIGPIENETASFRAVGAVIKLICFNVHDDARVLQVTSLSKKIVGTFGFSGNPLAISAVNSGTASEKTLTINFTASDVAACKNNMVFYIPVPSGDLGKLTFTIKTAANGTTLFSQTTGGTISVSRNQVVIPPVLNCSAGILMWSEKFTGYDGTEDFTTAQNIQTTSPTYEAFAYGGASIKYLANDSGTKVYPSDAFAGGAAPELLIKSGNKTFTVKNVPTNSAKKLYLSFKSNRTTLTITPSGDATASTTVSDGVVSSTISNPSALTSLDIEIKNTGSSNARVDDFELRAVESYTAPSITPASTSLTIAVAAGDENSASTTFTFNNPVDDLPLSAIASDDWIHTSISGSAPYTLTVTADKKTTAGSRAGSVILRATGVSKTISVSQPSALVSKPSVLVTPGDGTFTATWTKDENASGYVVYLGDPTDEANNVTAEVSFSAGTYTLTKDVANGDYDLYVGISGVTTYYVAESGYTHESFTCSDAAPTYAITINQPATGGTITAKGEGASAEAEEGEVVSLVATPATGYKLSAWSVTKKVGGAAITVTSNSFVMPAEPVIVTATFAAKEWVLVTNASTLAANQQIMLVATVSGSKTDANNGTFAANGTISSDIMGKVSATITSNKLTSYSGAQIFTLGKSGDNWTLSNGTSLLGATANKKIAWGSGTTTWTISITDGIATIDNTTSTYGKIKYNRDSPRFTVYTGDFSASMAGPMIFRYE